MSRIDDLIAEFSPDRVRFASLGELAQTVAGLSGKTKSDFTGGSGRYVSYKNVYSNLVVDQSWPDFVAVASGERQNRLHAGDVVFTGSSENVEDVGMASVVATEPTEPLYLNSFCFALRFSNPDLFLSGFSKYLFRAESVRTQVRQAASGVTRINLSKERFMRVRVPLPPLEVQHEIVRILDHFTEMEVELEAELEADLEARRRQHAFYRSRVFADIDADRVPLARFGKWTGGITPSKAEPRFWESGTIPWLASMDVSATGGREIRGRVTQAAIDETSLRVVPAPTVAVVMRSNILRRVLPIGRINVDVTVNQDIRLLTPGDGVDADYVYLALLAASEDIRAACVRTDGSMAAVNSGDFFAWEIPFPSLGEQRRVVSTLDKFDSLVNSLSEDLPAELNARRQQYEYYRDKLLTFEEAAA